MSDRPARLSDTAGVEDLFQAPFPLGILRGPDYRIEKANDAALRAWGKDERVIGMTLAEAMPHLIGQPFFGYLDEVRRTGAPYEGRGQLVMRKLPNGETYKTYTDLIYSPLRRADGTIDGILFVAFDATARVLAEKERDALSARLEAQERYFHDLVDNLPELAWTAPPNGSIDYFNRRWFEYTGISPEEHAAHGWRAVDDEDELQSMRARWRVFIDAGQPFETELRLRGRDGVHRWFLTRVRPQRDPDGKLVRWIGVNTDIDDRKRAEGFRETFLAILGHDLRNPLTTILATSRLLRMRPRMPEEHHAQLDRIVRSGSRMERMISQLLDITRARVAGGIPLQRVERPIDVVPIVSNIVDETQRAYPSRVIDLRLPTEPCAARLDQDRFEQVVSNLLGNAVVHGDPTTPVQVELTCEGEEIRLRVSNRGAPIPPDFLPVLFNPFARTSKPAGPSAGLGLGLYISERIVAAHGGRLLVHSTVEDGTRFDVLLPLENHP